MRKWTCCGQVTLYVDCPWLGAEATIRSQDNQLGLVEISLLKI
jgi:hypothetical protein